MSIDSRSSSVDNVEFVKDEDSDIEMIIENKIKEDCMELIPVKEEADIQELVDLTFRRAPKNKVVLADNLKLDDMIKLDDLMILRPENTIKLYKEKKQPFTLPSDSTRFRDPSAPEPSPAAPAHPTRKRRRQLPWDPLKNPRRNTALPAGTYDLPRVSEEELSKSESRFLIESAMKLRKRKIKGRLSTIVHEKIVIEFKFEMQRLPRVIMRIVQMDYLSTFHNVHTAICDMCGWSTSEYQNYKFIFYNQQKKQVLLGDSSLTEEKRLEERKYMKETILVDPLHPDYCELNYFLDDVDECRFIIKILKFVDKIESIDYPLCIRAKHLGPQGMKISDFKQIIEKIEHEKANENNQLGSDYEWWVLDKISKFDVEFPSFSQNPMLVRLDITDNERIRLVRNNK